MLRLDPFQLEILKTKGHKLLCSGRQTGKSTVISIDAGEYAIQHIGSSILIISATERQAEELFNKILFFLDDKYPKMIKRGRERPTKHILRLTNGSIIRCLPTGLAGIGIRGFTIDRLIADEAAFIPEAVWEAVTPMLLTTGGEITLVSTPHGKGGYFWKCYNDPKFKVFHVNSEDVIKNREISVSWSSEQREKAIAHLEQERKTMSKLKYAQEYLGQFVSDLRQWFPDNLIKSCMTAERKSINKDKTYFCGMDIARLGEDDTTFEILEKVNKDLLVQVENIVAKKSRINETVTQTLELDKQYNFRKIYIDDMGVGGGVFDYLLSNDQTKRKVEAINNSSRPLDREDTRHKKILKEDLYTNLLVLMEQEKIKLLKDDDIFFSLKSVQFEYVMEEGKDTRLKIWGDNTHICEGLIRSAWCNKDKSLNIWVR